MSRLIAGIDVFRPPLGPRFATVITVVIVMLYLPPPPPSSTLLVVGRFLKPDYHYTTIIMQKVIYNIGTEILLLT